MIVKKILIDNQYVPDLSKDLEYESFRLNADNETYTVTGVKSIRGVPFTITQVQGLIQLARMGKKQQVDEMVANSHSESIKIYYEYETKWERLSNLIITFGHELGMTEEDLDNFFLEASKIQ